MEAIQNAASSLLVNIALAVISLAGAYALYYIHIAAAKATEQIARIKDEAARKLFEDAITDTKDLVSQAVGAMEQTTAKALREQVKAGQVDREQLVKLSADVFTEVKRSISPEAQRVITKQLGSFDDYLTKSIEAAVFEVKQFEAEILLGAPGE